MQLLLKAPRLLGMLKLVPYLFQAQTLRAGEFKNETRADLPRFLIFNRIMMI